MKEIIASSETLFLDSIKAHFVTLNKDKNIHEGLQMVYEYFFNCFHDFSEKSEAVNPTDVKACKEAQRVFESFSLYLQSVQKAIKEEQDEGVKNALISKLDEGQQICAKLQSTFEYEDEEDDNEEGKKPSNILKR